MLQSRYVVREVLEVVRRKVLHPEVPKKLKAATFSTRVQRYKTFLSVIYEFLLQARVFVPDKLY
jgi:hypothetical protein